MSLREDPGVAEPGPIEKIGILGRLNWLRACVLRVLTGDFIRVGPGLLKRVTPDGIILEAIRSRHNPRSATATGTTSTSVTGGAACTLTSLQRDHGGTSDSGLDFLSLAANTITLKEPGFYLLRYNATLSIPLARAASVVPRVTQGKTILKIGTLEVQGTQGFVTAAEVPNLTGVNKLDDGETAVSVSTDIGGATGKTEAITPVIEIPHGFTTDEDYGLMSVATQVSALGIAELDGENKLDVTLDPNQDKDAEVNFSALSDEETELDDDSIKGCTGGTLLVDCHHNSDGELKIWIGGTPYAPTIQVWGIREIEGSVAVDVFSTSTSISVERR